MKLIVKDTKLQETSEILLRHFENLPETEIVIYPEYSETPGIQILKYGNNVKICYHEEVQYYRALGIVLGRKGTSPVRRPHIQTVWGSCLTVPGTACLKWRL